MAIILPRLGTIALIGLAIIGSGRQSPAAMPFPSGTWETADGRARIRTERCGATANQLCGYLVWLQKPLEDDGKPRIDRHNPNAVNQSRLILGHQILLGLKPNSKSQYEGQAYNGNNGKLYDVAVWSDTQSALWVKGCVFVFCGTQTWTRVADVLPGQVNGVTDLIGGPRNDPAWSIRPAETVSVPPHEAKAASR